MASFTGSDKFVTVAQAWNALLAFPRWLTAPMVLAEWTVEPRWHLALKHVRMLLVLAAYSLALYWLGGQAPLPTANMQAAAVPGALPLEANPVNAQALAPPTSTNTAALGAEDSAGLKIDDFRIGAVSGAPNRLRYELALSNKGRKLVGKLQFVVLGEQDGDIRELPVEAAAVATESKPRIEVARSLKTKGYLDLPEGYIVHKVVVQVVEGDSPRVTQSAPMWPT